MLLLGLVTIIFLNFMLTCIGLFLFFFSSRRRHTRFDCDWSSDVCSSDLRPVVVRVRRGVVLPRVAAAGGVRDLVPVGLGDLGGGPLQGRADVVGVDFVEIGRGSGRGRG